MYAAVLTLLLAADPVVPDAELPVQLQWAAVVASPRVVVANGPTGTGVVIAQRADLAYVLTSAHVVTLDGITLEFTTRETYPRTTWSVAYPDARVVRRWADPDLALIEFKVPVGRSVQPIPLAGPNQRANRFPVAIWTVGLADGKVADVRQDTLRAKRFVERKGHGPAFFWETDQPPEPGRSGGPLLDAKGRVIGLCAANRDGRGYYTHLDEILAALKRDGHGWLVTPKP